MLIVIVPMTSTPCPQPESTQMTSFYTPSSHDSYLCCVHLSVFHIHVQSPVMCKLYYLTFPNPSFSNMVTFTERLPKSVGGRRKSMSSV